MLLLFQTHLSANSSKTYKYQKVLGIQPYNLSTGRAVLYMHALALMVQPCLEALMESLLWYGVQGSCPITFHVFECCKTLTSKPILSREEPSQGVRPGKYGGFGMRAYPRVYISLNNQVVVTIDILSPFHPHMDMRFFATLGSWGAVQRVPSCLGLRESLQLLRYEPAQETAVASRFSLSLRR